MVFFFQTPSKSIYAVQSNVELSSDVEERLVWAFSGAKLLSDKSLSGFYVGPRKEMITPWSTNAVEIIQNMGVEGVIRIEEFFPVEAKDVAHDPMLQVVYNGLSNDLFTIDKKKEPIREIEDITKYQ